LIQAARDGKRWSVPTSTRRPPIAAPASGRRPARLGQQRDAFLAGYGAAQAVPGPLFTFAAYLGAVMSLSPNGWKGALICLVAIFLPSFLIVIGALPFWEDLRRRAGARAALAGVNAAVVGLLIAAFYDPIWTVGITNAMDFALALAAFLLLFVWQVPPWAVVILCALGGGAHRGRLTGRSVR
jgi:chromate transporter